jgi:chitinase
MKHFFYSFLLFDVVFLLLISCSKDGNEIDPYLKEPICYGSFNPRLSDYQVVGFYPYYKREVLPFSDIPWEKITRIVYAFAIPNQDGTLNTSFLTGISQLVEMAHTQGVEVYFSVGGGGSGSDNFPEIAADQEAATRFVLEIRQFIFENCLDGVDIDWEYWTGSVSGTVVNSESMALVHILNDLEKKLEPYDLGISIDVPASHWGGKHFMDQAAEYVDHIQVMAYDFSGPWSPPGPHSSYEDAIGSGADITSTGLAYWVNFRRWQKENILLGVPFYGRDFDNQQGAGIAYSDILELYPDAWQFDQVANIYYNGIPTMTQKAQFVKEQHYAGIMIWELAHDHPADSLSLLNAIDQVLGASLNARLTH